MMPLRTGQASAISSGRASARVARTAPSMVWGGKDYLIAPSILSADFAKLGAEVDAVLNPRP